MGSLTRLARTGVQGFGAMNEEISGIIAQLELVAASLTDLSMSLLSEAIEAGADHRPEMERRISQARRAVEKAIHHLGANPSA